jgi:hypothetical protein
VVALGVAALLASSASGARDRAWDPPPCSRSPLSTTSTSGRGTWWRVDPVIVDGTLTARRLAAGAPGERRARIVDMDPESFAAGPFAGLILAGTDDGAHSSLSVIDPAGGCAVEIDRSTDIIRRATLTPERDAVLEFRLDRDTRAELGTFRVPIGDHAATAILRVVDPIEPDERFGPTWTTEFAWSDDGGRLAIQSCGAIACRTRVLDQVSGAVAQFGDLSHGDLVGVAGGHVVLREACGGLPCPLLSIDIDSGEQVTLDDEAGLAVTTMSPDGTGLVVFEDGDGDALRTIDVRGRSRRDLSLDVRERRLVAPASRSDAAVDLAPGMVVLGPDGLLPLDGSIPPVVVRLADGATLDLEEVSR